MRLDRDALAVTLPLISSLVAGSLISSRPEYVRLGRATRHVVKEYAEIACAIEPESIMCQSNKKRKYQSGCAV
jgi:hypothetical protein